MGVAERRLREREARVEAILNAALKVFAARGFQEATIDEVAEEAELGKGTIYYYFPSKEAILKELVETTVDHHFNGIRERVRQAANPLEVAMAIIDGFVANYQKQPELFRLFYMVLASPPGEVAQALRAFSRRHREWLQRLEEDVGELLRAHGLPSAEFIGFIGTHVHGIVLLAISGRNVEELEEESFQALRRFIG